MAGGEGLERRTSNNEKEKIMKKCMMTVAAMMVATAAMAQDATFNRGRIENVTN